MILAYLRQRFRLSFFGWVALILAGAALGRTASVMELAAATAAALCLLAQFRIWDDIADRSHDAIAHPDRVLVSATTLAPLVALGLALLTINAGMALRRDDALVSTLCLALIHAALGGYYLCRRGRTVFGDQLLLVKYPAFVCILAGERLLASPLQVFLGAAIVYGAASAYEAWHDPVSPLAQYLGGRS